MLHRLKTHEALRLAAAKWLLANDKRNICCFGNELGHEFLQSYTLQEEQGELYETLIDGNNSITLVFKCEIRLNAREAVCGRPVTFTYLRYVRALYDDSGNVYRYVTMGYNF